MSMISPWQLTKNHLNNTENPLTTTKVVGFCGEKKLDLDHYLINILPSVKHGDGRIMLWCCFPVTELNRGADGCRKHRLMLSEILLHSVQDIRLWWKVYTSTKPLRVKPVREIDRESSYVTQATVFLLSCSLMNDLCVCFTLSKPILSTWNRAKMPASGLWSCWTSREVSLWEERWRL